MKHIICYRVKGPLLFTYISQNDAYIEADVCEYSKQLMSALSWLHGRDLAHLDVKVKLFLGLEKNKIQLLFCFSLKM